MCGIGGVIGSRVGLDLDALLRALDHRGPDGRGVATPHDGVWLCATRLALRDATLTGAQPMTDGNATVVYNGELYNHVELARALGCEATGDTALLLAAYRRWGVAMLERIEGMYAFALYDATSRSVLLARDPQGIKPLWMTTNGRVAFASEVRPLLRAGLVEPRLDPAAIDAYLATGSAPEPRGLLRDLEALAPGTYALHDLDGRSRRTRFWSLPSIPRDSRSEIAARLADVVPRTLVADSEVALLLSDGVDSAALALLARPRRSFHLRCDDTSARIAADRARRLGLDHVEIPVEDDASAWLEAQDQPSIDGLNTWMVARGVHRAGVKAVLSGVGGDELFGGYTHYRLRVKAPSVLRRPARLLARAQSRLQLAGLPSGSWRAAKALELGAGLSPAIALRRLYPHALRRRLYPATRRDVSTVKSPPAHDLEHYLVDTVLRDADVMSMAHGVELRVPFLDAKLVALVTALPEPLRFARDKGLLLDAVPGLSALVVPGKRGFELPIERLLRGAFGAELRALAHDRSLVARCGLDHGATSTLLARIHTRPDAFRALALGALLAWVRRHEASI